MNDHVLVPLNPWSNVFLMLGLIVSITVWSKRPRQSIEQLPVLLGALIGGFVGAKLSFLLAEWPLWFSSPGLVWQLLYGKSILGGLLGGWVGVEFAKWQTGQTQRFGDEFARIIPLGIGLGRLSCLAHGCCQGRLTAELPWAAFAHTLETWGWTRWPAAVAELLFQVGFLAVSYALKDQPRLRGQHFHLYLISYGLFRGWHETWRDTPRYFGDSFAPYQWLALACALAGAWGFWQRWRSDRQPMGLQPTT